MECGDFITNDEWPAEGPDLNPRDYRLPSVDHDDSEIFEVVGRFDSVEKLRLNRFGKIRTKVLSVVFHRIGDQWF